MIKRARRTMPAALPDTAPATVVVVSETKDAEEGDGEAEV